MRRRVRTRKKYAITTKKWAKVYSLSFLKWKATTKFLNVRITPEEQEEGKL